MTYRMLILGLAAALLAPAGATRAEDEAALRFAAAADCSQAAADAAAKTGGRVLTVSSRNDGGRTVCVVTVLIPADGGGRPRKQTVVLPQ
ncbi:hypothetical protein [Aureimonas endophytica]|nr:hypothetical protein [Aureimonas endophytica]